MEPQTFIKPHLIVYESKTKMVIIDRFINPKTKVYTKHVCVNLSTEEDGEKKIQELGLNKVDLIKRILINNLK